LFAKEAFSLAQKASALRLAGIHCLYYENLSFGLGEFLATDAKIPSRWNGNEMKYKH
jgi:hypothetical protein